MNEPKRIQRRRVKGWRMPPDTVSITRPGKWGNPFKVGSYSYEVDAFILNPFNAKPVLVKDVEMSLRMYKEYIDREVKFKRRNLEELRGKNLACFCKEGEPCHGDVLLELSNK